MLCDCQVCGKNRYKKQTREDPYYQHPYRKAEYLGLLNSFYDDESLRNLEGTIDVVKPYLAKFAKNAGIGKYGTSSNLDCDKLLGTVQQFKKHCDRQGVKVVFIYPGGHGVWSSEFGPILLGTDFDPKHAFDEDGKLIKKKLKQMGISEIQILDIFQGYVVYIVWDVCLVEHPVEKGTRDIWISPSTTSTSVYATRINREKRSLRKSEPSRVILKCLEKQAEYAKLGTTYNLHDLLRSAANDFHYDIDIPKIYHKGCCSGAGDPYREIFFRKGVRCLPPTAESLAQANVPK